MSGLVEFLKARLDEDEQVAKEAPYELNNGEWPFWPDVDDQSAYAAASAYRDQFRPARMLAEVEMKRLWLKDHEGVHRCDWGDQLGADYLGWCHVVKRFALPFADHPDYCEEWRP